MRLGDGRFLADQNIDEVVAAQLRREGADIVTSAELGLARASGHVILASAVEHDRILLTHDTGSGDMVIRERRVHRGCVLLRPGHAYPKTVLELLGVALAIEGDEGSQWLMSARAGPRRPAIRVRSTA